MQKKINRFFGFNHQIKVVCFLVLLWFVSPFLQKSLESLHPIITPLICHYLVQPKSYATAEQSSSQADRCEASADC
jgi:hypothetical protein